MKERIKKALPWINLVLLLVALYGLWAVAEDYIGWVPDWFTYFASLPAMELNRYITKEAIDIFGGEETPLSDLAKSVYLAGAGMVILFVISPYLLTKGYKKLENSDGKVRGFGWYFGAFVLLSGLVSSFGATTIGTVVYFNTLDSAAASRDTDELRAELATLALDASEMMLLPHQLGGGNGAFTTFRNDEGAFRNIVLEDLDSYKDSDKFDFIIHDSISDSSIVILGVSNYKGKNTEFENANGETGKKQVSVTVTPHEEEVFSLRASTFTN